MSLHTFSNQNANALYYTTHYEEMINKIIKYYIWILTSISPTTDIKCSEWSILYRGSGLIQNLIRKPITAISCNTTHHSHSYRKCQRSYQGLQYTFKNISIKLFIIMSNHMKLIFKQITDCFPSNEERRNGELHVGWVKLSSI